MGREGSGGDESLPCLSACLISGFIISRTSEGHEHSHKISAECLAISAYCGVVWHLNVYQYIITLAYVRVRLVIRHIYAAETGG